MSTDEEGAPVPDAGRKRVLAYERASFVGWLDDLANLPPEKEFQRAVLMLGYLSQLIASPYLSPEKCFQRVYGKAGANGFWAVECSDPVKWDRALRLFAVMLAHDRGREIYCDNRNFLFLSHGIGSQFVDAFHAGAKLFIGDTSALEIVADDPKKRRVSYGWEVKPSPSLRVDIRRAAEWLLSKPKRVPWVPTSLAAFLRAPQLPASVPSDTAPKRTGPTGVSYRATDAPLIQEMRTLIQFGPAKDRWTAALIVSEKAKGAGSGQSKAKRLLKLYSDTFRN